MPKRKNERKKRTARIGVTFVNLSNVRKIQERMCEGGKAKNER